MEKFKRRFYDSHPQLPLDPDSEQLQATRPMHTDAAHIAVVAFGGFFGILARYEVGLWIPNSTSDLPVALRSIGGTA